MRWEGVPFSTINFARVHLHDGFRLSFADAIMFRTQVVLRLCLRAQVHSQLVKIVQKRQSKL